MLVIPINLPHLAALILQLVLGVAVFQANPRGKPNQCFLLLAAAISVWLGSLFLALSAGTVQAAAFYIRQASASAALILTAANFLRLSIAKRDKPWRTILADSWSWLIAAAAVVLFCQSKFFLRGARLSAPSGAEQLLPVPTYGSWAFLYVVYFGVAGAAVIFTYTREARSSQGIRRAELTFIVTGAIIALTTVVIAFLLGFAIERSRIIWFAPFRVVLFSLVVAYGIATKKIMDVGLFLRRAMSYLLLAAYLLCLYLIIWFLVAIALAPVLPAERKGIAHVVAALTIAFAMAPARGFSQTLADRLLRSTGGLNFQVTVQRAAAVLESVTTLPELLSRFSSIISEALLTEDVSIYLFARDEVFLRRYSQQLSADARPEYISPEDPIIRHLRNRREPIIKDELYRNRASEESDFVRIRFRSLNVAAVFGIFTRENLTGIVLLGERLGGQIYGSNAQGAIQVLCRQLAVAIDNAELFTEVQNAKIYNETLLQNLTTGVIAADADGNLTVFNNEAAQITGLNPAAALQQKVRDLPVALHNIMQLTLDTGERQQDREVELRVKTGNLFVRASSSIFHGQNGELLGALMVITDITALKRLELQIRRSDRLASLGTLSAGMAHEIKNPLVSIKTFAQLLPERYHDTDFRDTFSTLIVHEIDRIDSLVNQLLRFARPAKPLLRPMHLHDVLEKTLSLVQHRLYQKEIKLTRIWAANMDTIHADADQLEQVFLNFFLNAMDAMSRGGELTVSTEVETGDALVSRLSGIGDQAFEALRVSVRDTGVGIRSEDLPHVFDPFFTTKDYGTGLGLSVVHGIIQEHGGQIEVESELTRGTAFHIFLPLVRFNEEVAAA